MKKMRLKLDSVLSSYKREEGGGLISAELAHWDMANICMMGHLKDYSFVFESVYHTPLVF